MEVNIEIPADADDFLSRGCPTCEQRFKWFIKETVGTPADWVDPDNYYCPLCGVAADSDSFWTREQLDFAEEHALQQFSPELDRMIDGAFRSASSKHVSFKRTGRIELGSNPSPPVEFDEMVAVASPCHPFEPVKVPRDLNSIHCLVCGSIFEI